MPNQEIITSLRNAIEHGDSLQNAMQIMINSGYSPQEVQGASKYVSGITPNFQPTESEQLTMPGKPMPEKKSFFSKINIFKKKTEQQPVSQQIQPIQQQQTQQQPIQQKPTQQPIQQIPQLTPTKQSQPLSKQLSKIKPRHNYIKEIILLSILIVLVGLLITTIIYRDAILGFFSG